ncbi:hypothetical protein K3495_g6924 [Podosphaera aphanis]|nr:hypothetical protein K3495_g6924 [Podosphaera aphanis]
MRGLLPITAEVRRNILAGLAENSINHPINVNSKVDIDDEPSSFLSRYSSETFRGILIDSGAADFSTAGYQQYKAFQQAFGKAPLITDNKIKVRFGKGQAESIGFIDVKTPIGPINFYVVDCDTPFLLSLKNMDNLGMIFDNVSNLLIHKKTNTQYRITQKFGYAFLTWQPDFSSLNKDVTTFLTQRDLKRLHCRFGHPSVDWLHRILKNADHEDSETKKLLNRITEHCRYCRYCQMHGPAPQRFKFKIKDDFNFNFAIIIDIIYLDGNTPVLHVVDEATRYQAAQFLKDVSAQTVWETLRRCWIDIYVGPPDLIIHDSGTNFTSREFQQSAATLIIRKKCVPVEAAQSVGMVERYHGPLRRAYKIVSEELKSAAKFLKLQMAVKALNDTVGPNSLTPTLLVYGTYPKMASIDPPAPSIQERASAIAKAMLEVRKLHAQRQISDALNQRNGPDPGKIHELKIGDLALVWRIHLTKWTGPYKVIDIQGESFKLNLPSGPTEFRATSVKPFRTDENISINTPNNNNENEKQSNQKDNQSLTDNTPSQELLPIIRPQRNRRLPDCLRRPDVVLYFNTNFLFD